MDVNSIEIDRSSGRVQVEDDVELFYRTVGTGEETVVFLHGGPSFSLDYFLPDIQPLARGRRLLLYDQRSCGRSTLVEDGERNTIDDMVGDLETLRNHFDIEELTLVGHSWGGFLAGCYAREHPSKVARIVIVGGSGPAPETWREEFNPSDSIRPEHRQALERHRAAAADDPESMRKCWDFWSINAESYHSTPQHVGQMWGDLCDRPPAKIRSDQPVAGIGDRPDIRDDLVDVTAPTLVVHAEDGPIPLSAPRAWVDALPNAQLFLMPTGGHVPWVDRPDVFFPAVESFLRGRWPDPPESDGTWTPPSVDDHSPEPGTYEALFAAIEEAGAAYADALNDGDWERAAACFTEDGMLLGPAAPPARGARAIAAFWEVAYERGFREVDLQPIEVEGIGDRAFELGKYEVSGEDEVLLDFGKYMVHWRETGEGWQLYRDIYNSSQATQSPLEVPHHLPPPEGTFGLE